jgi:ferritin-like protein
MWTPGRERPIVHSVVTTGRGDPRPRDAGASPPGNRQSPAISAISRNRQEKAMSSIGYHEPVEELSAATRDMHRAIVSLMEELEAVDWYNQRAEACADAELQAIIEHNRDEEKEHAAMLLEWIRRHDARLSKELTEYLFTEKPIADQ